MMGSSPEKVKGAPTFRRAPFEYLGGFEPPTVRLVGGFSILLSYRSAEIVRHESGDLMSGAAMKSTPFLFRYLNAQLFAA